MVIPAERQSGRLIIRADASESIGGGHIMRCLALAGAWAGQEANPGEAKFEVMFASAEITEALKARILRQGHRFHAIEAQRGSAKDAELTRNLATEWCTAAVVLDGYCFAMHYQSMLRNGPFLLVLYDDQGDAQAFACDVLVNQNISARAEDYIRRAPGATLLMGAQYAALRPEFLELRQRPRDYSTGRKVLVSLGLSDTTETLKSILGGFDRIADVPLSIDVLAGTGNLAELARMTRTLRHQVKCLATIDNFAEKLLNTDIAILAGGGTAHEAACLGTPMIMVCIADNQQPAYREFVRRGAALDGGMAAWINPESFGAVAARLLGSAELRAKCAGIAREAVDGRGAARVAAAIKNLRTGGKVFVPTSCR